ncbi:Maf family protein [Nitrincola sp.]|uniref:Maf family protein n=1 Tax=Nitrincola sp. TaxID=1926584 RepID=UPI003A931BB2
MTELILASASPRRRALLEQIGVAYQVVPSSICEAVQAGETPSGYTMRLALEKALSCYRQLDRPGAVLGADTSVAIDGNILGKPEDEADAISMLMRLSGRTHQVITAVALVTPQQHEVIHVTSEVSFSELNETLCRAYWHTGEPLDKAGGYAIQGKAAVFVSSITGSYSGVVGLPLFETAALLQRHGVMIWQQGAGVKEHAYG